MHQFLMRDTCVHLKCKSGYPTESLTVAKYFLRYFFWISNK